MKIYARWREYQNHIAKQGSNEILNQIAPRNNLR